jgi:hypothetical protein
LVQTYADYYDVVSSGSIESPQEYEARMHEFAQEKAIRRAERKDRWREIAGLDDEAVAERPPEPMPHNTRADLISL